MFRATRNQPGTRRQRLSWHPRLLAAPGATMEAPGALADRWGGKQYWQQTDEGRTKEREVKKRLRKQAKKHSKKVRKAVIDAPDRRPATDG